MHVGVLTSNDEVCWAALPTEDPGTAPVLRSGHDSALANGVLFVVGGVPCAPTTESMLSDAWALDVRPVLAAHARHSLLSPSSSFIVPLATRWRRLPNLPISLAYHRAFLWNNALYVFGGFTGSQYNTILFRLNVFDARASSAHDMLAVDLELAAWEAVPLLGSPPAGLSGCTANVVGDALIVYGGYNGVHYSSTMHVLNLETSTWIHVLDGPRVSAYHASAVVDGHVYVLGGFSGQECHPSLFCTLPKIAGAPAAAAAGAVVNSAAPSWSLRNSILSAANEHDVAAQVARVAQLFFGAEVNAPVHSSLALGVTAMLAEMRAILAASSATSAAVSTVASAAVSAAATAAANSVSVNVSPAGFGGRTPQDLHTALIEGAVAMGFPHAQAALAMSQLAAIPEASGSGITMERLINYLIANPGLELAAASIVDHEEEEKKREEAHALSDGTLGYNQHQSLHPVAAPRLERNASTERSALRAELQLAKDELERSRMCCVCENEEINSVFMPCMHVCACVGCAKSMLKRLGICPICRESLTDVKEVFWS